MVILSEGNLNDLTRQSIDQQPLKKARPNNRFSGLADDKLVNEIESRNQNAQPTHALREEYKRRLDSR